MNHDFKVVQLIYNYAIEGGGGGITRCVIDISEYLKDFCHVSIISLGNFGNPIESNRISMLNSLGIEAFAAIKWDNKAPYTSFLSAYQNISDYISKTNANVIIHSHSEFTDVIALLLKIQQKASRIIRTCHYGYKVEWKDKPLRRFLFTNLSYPLFFNYEVGVNRRITSRLDNRLLSKLLNKKSVWISEGINLNKFSNPDKNKSDCERMLGIPSNVYIIGTIGRLVEQKGQKYLLMAAQKIIELYPNTRFIIVGDGPLRNDLEAISIELGIDQWVLFLGGRSDIKELLQCFDIFVLPSLWEGLPISLLESMASNVPVITTNIPGCTDVIENGKSGILVPPKDFLSLSQAIIHLLGSKTLRKTLSENAYHVVQNFSIKYIADKYYQLYLSLLGSG